MKGHAQKTSFTQCIYFRANIEPDGRRRCRRTVIEYLNKTAFFQHIPGRVIPRRLQDFGGLREKRKRGGRGSKERFFLLLLCPEQYRWCWRADCPTRRSYPITVNKSRRLGSVGWMGRTCIKCSNSHPKRAAAWGLIPKK